MKILSMIRKCSGILCEGSDPKTRSLFLKLAFFSILILGAAVSAISGDKLVRLYLGSALRIEPGLSKNTGFGELHCGFESKVFYGALAVGVASKSLLTSIQLENPDMIKVLDTLVQSDTEVYIGGVFDYLVPLTKESLTFDVILPGHPKVNTVFGAGGRSEFIYNFSPSKSEKDTSPYNEWGLYGQVYFVLKPVAIFPMIGIGQNGRLDRHFVRQGLLRVEQDNIFRWKLRIDMSTLRLIKIGKVNVNLFLAFQYDWPTRETSMLQLDDETLVEASLRQLREMSLRLGISFDLFAK